MQQAIIRGFDTQISLASQGLSELLRARARYRSELIDMEQGLAPMKEGLSIAVCQREIEKITSELSRRPGMPKGFSLGEIVCMSVVDFGTVKLRVAQFRPFVRASDGSLTDRLRVDRLAFYAPDHDRAGWSILDVRWPRS